MSTIKSSAENLTLNADGANNDIIFQSNGTTKATLDQAGLLTATSFAGSGANLTGLPASGLPLTGGTMTGAIVLNNTNLTTGDSTSNANKIRMGASNDLNIHHDGSNSYIEDSGTGSLRILGSSIELRNAPSDNELMLKATTDGSVELYHNNVKKIETTATGVAVTGGVAIGGTGTANTLDDYEEGTWTPAVASVTTSCSMGSVYTSHYTKIGNVVKLYTSFDIDSSANPGTGNLRFTGFPFALKTLGEGAFLISVYYNYKPATMAFMSKNGYTYYTNTTVNGNNLGPLVETIGQSTTNVFGMQFTYLTDA